MNAKPSMLLPLLSGLLLGALTLNAADPESKPKAVEPGPKDRCATCGMFPAKYKQWIAQVHWKNGERNYFDGSKCMFRALQNQAKYLPGKKADDLAAIYVTNYYTSKPIEGTGAFYVIGSDVLGPMGKELIAFSSMDEAKEFMTDHKGTGILRFKEVTPSVIKPLLHKKKH